MKLRSFLVLIPFLIFSASVALPASASDQSGECQPGDYSWIDCSSKNILTTVCSNERNPGYYAVVNDHGIRLTFSPVTYSSDLAYFTGPNFVLHVSRLANGFYPDQGNPEQARAVVKYAAVGSEGLKPALVGCRYHQDR